jgi:murein DD-endopeptidase MepM/ murein hydrolase activator NlpD
MLALASCKRDESAALMPFDAAFVRLSALEIATLPVAVRFDPPLGGERGALTYDAQPFRTTRHMGSDLNGVGGWNSDLGDPVFASGTGKVVYCGVPGEGWGSVVIIAHRVPEPGAPHGWRVYQTMYAHMEKVLARQGDLVKRAQQIGTVGTANGRYFAHLHFEVRRSLSVYPGVGYADSPLERVSPAEFVRMHQGAPDDLLNAPP